MAKVEPFEHRGMRISKISIDSESKFLEVYQRFLNEPDKWLRKMLAKKLIDAFAEYGKSVENSALQEATKCRVE